jgi:MFS superfamily sulfate permease-like transporter
MIWFIIGLITGIGIGLLIACVVMNIKETSKKTKNK